MKKMIKNLLKKKEKFPTTNVPRSQEEIKKIYFELRARLGENSYQVEVLTQDAKQLVEGMKSLNYEMDARQKLDQESAKELAAAEAVKTGFNKAAEAVQEQATQ